MRNLEKFNHVDKNDSFYFVDENALKEHNISFEEASNVLISFDIMSDLFKEPKEKILDIAINVFHVTMRDLFDYTTYNHSKAILIKENGVYTKKKVEKTYNYWITQKIFHNVYLTENKYIELKMHNIGLYLLEQKFPHIFKNELFFKEVRRFPQNFYIKPYHRISDIDFINAFNGELRDLTCQDITDLINNPRCINDIKKTTLFKYYACDNVVYLEIGKRQIHQYEFNDSLVIPFQALFEKDWSLIEKYNVSGIVKNDANKKMGQDNNNYFSGKQCDCPYWENNKMIEELKKIFLNC